MQDQQSWAEGPTGASGRHLIRRCRPRNRPAPRGGRVVMAAFLVLGALAACTSGSAVDDGTTAAASDSTSAAGPAPRLYLSIGDSYAAGYQPTGTDSGATTTNGFAYLIADDATDLGHPVTLVNVGCSGATSTQIVTEDGCEASALGPGAAPYPDRTQAEAALAALAAYPSAVDLVTIVMGGNDVQGCLFDGDPQGCIEEALPTVSANVAALTKEIRAVIGPEVPIVGLTYPDAYLGAAVVGGRDGVDGAQLATMSLQLFKTYLNPVLEAAYTDNGAQFVDITALAGTYQDLAVTTQADGQAAVPVAVADTCRLTFYCQYQDVHPTNEGHRLIADAVLKAALDG